MPCTMLLPALEDRVADGTPAVDLCLRRNNHQQEEHVDRALFNIVTGSAEAMKRLHFSSTAVPGMASAGGAVVLIPGMTSALLLAHEDGSLSMPPKHSVDAPTSLAEQLTVVAVCVRADIPVRVLCWTSLQQALVGCFATTHQPQPQARPAVGARPAVMAKVEAAPQAKRARTEDVPTGPVPWSLVVQIQTGKTIQVTDLNGASLVADVIQAIDDTEGILADIQRLVFAGRRLEHDRTLADYGLKDGDTVHLIFNLRGD
ncbi:60S ribosomal protein L40, partial [Haematococcus lacustris]